MNFLIFFANFANPQVREADAKVVFGENWHSDNSFHTETCSYSILRGAVVPRLGVNDTLFSSVEAAFEALIRRRMKT